MKQELTLRYVNECLSYDPDTGVFTWKKRPWHHFKLNRDENAWNGRYAGKVAGCKNPNGYIIIRINNIIRFSHRLAWMIVYNENPTQLIDHINGNPSDNRISNLRLATLSENARNQKRRSDNTSGIKGVSFNRIKNAWRCELMVDQKIVFIEYHKSIEKAKEAIELARERIHGEYSNHGLHLCHTPS